MDFHDFGALIRERHAEMLAEARRHALLAAMRPQRCTLRVAVGTVLMRVGAWLLREHDAVHAGP